MNTSVSYRYQLASQIKGILIYYFVVLCVLIILITTSTVAISVSSADDGFNGRIVGMEFASIIYLFVAACNSFSEEFGMLMQNATSRKSLFVGRVLTVLTISSFMAIIDKLIYFINKAAYSDNKYVILSLFDIFYNMNPDSFKTQIFGLFFHLSFYLFASGLGYLFTVIFYRSGKGGRLGICVGLPVGLFVVFPLVDSIVNGKISEAIIRGLDKIMGVSAHRPLYGIISCSLIFIGLSVVSWLLIRRANVRE